MKRQIKFKLWNGSKMIWPYMISASYSNCDFYTMNLSPMDIPEDKAETALLQFTGFKDFNGKEIYEGDVISFTVVRDGTQKKRFEIYFDISCGSWYCKNGQELSYILFEQNNDDWKRSQNWSINQNQYVRVIGNVYENPKLLNP